jgi:hypothetical protein
MKLLGKFTFLFTGVKKEKLCLQNNPSPTLNEVTSYPNTFCKNNPSFSIITKIPFLLAFKFFLKKSFTQTHTSFTLVSIYFTLTINVPSLQIFELSH